MRRKEKPGVEEFNRAGFTLDQDFKELKKLYELIKSEMPAADVALKLEEKEILIPSCIFNKKFSAFESVVKYLKENKGMHNRQIALLLCKSQKSIWQTYHLAMKKHAKGLDIVDSPYYIPISIFKKPFTVLESIVKYCRERLNMSYHETASMLHRDERTIWTTYERAKQRAISDDGSDYE
jgi:hypothetical protein